MVVYTKEIMKKEVARYNKEFVEQKRAFGELGQLKDLQST